MQEAIPFISVIVPVYNDSSRIGKCVEALLDQAYPKDKYEIVVVDNGSTDDTRTIVGRYPVRLFVKDVVQSSYAARNKGIKNSRGEIIAFTDSDCIPDKNWLEKGVMNLQKVPNCGLVAGRINIFFEIPDKPNAIELYDSITNFKQKDDVELRKFGSTANVFTYRRVLEHVGLFKESLKSGGDNEWGRRVFASGYNQIYADDTCVAHPARNSYAQLYKRYTRLIGGCYDQYWKNSYSAYIKESIKSLRNITVLYGRVLLGLCPSEWPLGIRRKLKIVVVYTFVQIISAWERTRLLMGGKSKN